MRLLDEIIILVYVGLSIAVGIGFRGRQQSAQDYFTASGQMHGGGATFLVGMSLAASFFSGITFIAYPSIVYQNGPLILLTCLTFVVAWLSLRYWFLPRYFAHGGTTPYQILSDRFGRPVRTTASVIFILLRISWMSTLLYVPSVILTSAAGFSQDHFWLWLFGIGSLCTLLSTIGGLRGLVVTDAMQFLLIFIGLVCVIVTQLAGLTGSDLAGIFSAKSGLWAQPLRFDLNLTATYSFWTILLGYSAGIVSAYMADQVTLQRYLSVGQVRPACRSFAYNLIGSCLVCLLLATIGVLLRVWHQVHPAASLPADPDWIMPYFVVHHLPVGIVGLFFAALLAATVNCMSSAINALAGCVTNDFIAPRLRNASASTLLNLGRVCSIAIGLLAVLGVSLIKNLGTIWEIANRIQGVFQGPLLAVMVMACLPAWRIPGWCVMLGVAGGCAAGLESIHARVDSMWVPFFSFAASILLSYGLNLLRAPSPAAGTVARR